MASTSLRVSASSAVTSGERVRAANLPAVFGGVTVLVGTLAVLALHVVAPTSAISPLRRTISEYAYSELGWVFNSGVLAIAGGSLLITVSLWSSGTLRPLSAGSVALLAWTAALVVLVIFPKHNWAVGPSSSGSIHRVASLIAFASVPIAAIVIARRRAGRLRTPARLTLFFGIIAATWLTALLGGFVVGPITDTPWWQVFPLGLMERGMAAFAVAAVLALGWLAFRAAGPAAAAGVDRPGGRVDAR